MYEKQQKYFSIKRIIKRFIGYMLYRMMMMIMRIITMKLFQYA